MARIKLSRWAKENGVHYQTALRYWHKGLLRGVQLPTGTILVDAEDAAIAAAPREEKTVWRGIRLYPSDLDGKTVDDYLATTMAPGIIHQDPGYASTTYNPGSARSMSTPNTNGDTGEKSAISLVYEITTEEGVPVRSDDFWEGAEVLLPRGARLQVESVEREALFGYPSGKNTERVLVKVRHLGRENPPPLPERS